MNWLRRLADRSPLRGVLLHPMVRRFVSWLFALRFVPAVRHVDRPIRFLVRDVRRSGTHAYRLRRRGTSLVIRHDTGGMELLHEIFSAGCYRTPPGVVGAGGSQPARVLDVGANVGAFSVWAGSRWPGVHITAIEPDAANIAALRRCRDLNPSSDVEVIEAAATTHDGVVRFNAGAGTGSRLADDGEECRAIDVLPLLHDADFVKIDIEGGEWPILADPRLADTGPLVMVLEYHRRAPGDTGALDAAKAALAAAGFEVGHETPNHWGHGLLWAWKGEAGQRGADDASMPAGTSTPLSA